VLRPRFPGVKVDFRPMKGGLDLVTPAIQIDPGKCFDAQNYEPDPVGGYRRINGNERFDGRTSPTSAHYWVLSILLTGTIAVGDTVTGATSGATGKVLGLYDANTTLVLGRVSGTFVISEAVQVTAVTQATTTSASVSGGASLPSDDADYRLLAANDRRADILTVPGSGDIRGGFVFNDLCYVFRDNALGTAGDLYKQTTSGWSKVIFGTEIQFTTATGQISDGDTITGATSGATGIVVRSMLRTGTWTASGVGTLIITGIVGTFQNAELLKVGGVAKATSSSLATTITRSAGGRIETVIGNFSGSTATKYVYGCDGVNLAFEFDGANYIPIRTGMATDTPVHIATHKSHLFLSFGGSLQYSGINAPYSWTVLTGAAEIGMGDDITGLLPQTGNAAGASLGVFTAGKTSILYGSGSTDFNLVPSVHDLGYRAHTVQPVGNNSYGLTARGIQSLITTLNYGDFQYAAVSFFVQPLLASKVGLETASVSLKTKNQYRLYFSDNTGLVVGLTGEKISGIMPVRYPVAVKCVWSDTLSTGEEVTFFGSTDGYVYKDNVGTSFDGAKIEAWIRPAFNNLGSPRVRKQYRRAIFEVACEGYSSVNVTYDLGYGAPSVTTAAVQLDQSLLGDGGYWEQFTWDAFTWDSPVVSEAELSIDGTEKNIGFLFYSNRAQDDSHTVSGVSLLFTPRRVVHSGS
jgi:hypothetical protein